MAPRWNCECCCEDFHDYTSIEIEGSQVCPACIKGIFDKALKFEHEYPPRWTDHIHPSDFSHILSADYIERYKHKEIEYNTQPSKRVYCQYQVKRSVSNWAGDDATTKETCGGFIGVRQKLNKPDIMVLGRCRECKNASCMVCDDVPGDPVAILQHVCTGKSLENEKRAQAFVGLKRGRDWQMCPRRQCGRRIELSEACNHITCNCGTGFCFICGKEADGDSEHWTSRKSGCPRYNHPDDIDAEYDEGSEYDEDEVIPRPDVLEEDGDPLDNVRDLFALDGDDNTVAAVSVDVITPETPLVVTESEGIVPAILAPPPAFADFHTGLVEQSRGWRVPPPPFTDVRPGLVEQLGQLHRALVAFEEEHNATDTPEAEQSIGEENTTADTLEANPMSTNDAEAIASTFWEDDLSDDGHYTYEVSGNGDELVVTQEEAEVDRALWRMQIE